MGTNAFEAVCEKAATERWCWNLWCTTCGHMHFRFALRDIASGIHPTSTDWAVKRSRTKGYGDVPRSFSLTEQIKLINIFEHSSIQNISEVSDFPNWLGYLGIALYYTAEVEIEEHRISGSWIPQLANMVETGVAALPCLEKNEVLTWESLERYETSLIGAKV